MASLKPLTIGACLLAFANPSAGAQRIVDSGVVVEEVARGFAAHAAGLQPGDLIISWSREANPPANPQSAQGQIHTPFDLVELEIERAPHGQLKLAGLRGGTLLSWILPQDEWRLRTRPKLSGSAADLYEEGRGLLSGKRVREGADRWRAAGDAVSGLGPTWLHGWFLLRAAEVLTESQDFELADELYADAERMLKGQRAEGPRAHLLRIWSLSYLQRNLWDEALQRLADALECERQREPTSLAMGHTEYSLGKAAYSADRLAEAESHYQRALALQERLAPRSAAVADTLSARGQLATKRDLHLARDYLQRAHSLHEATAPASVALAVDLSWLGWIAYLLGDLDSAAAYFNKALPRLEDLAPENPALPNNLVGMGNVEFRRGNFSLADALFRQALDLSRRFHPRRRGQVLIGLGTVALRRRDLEMAQRYYEEALVVFETTKSDSDNRAVALHQLGDVALLREDSTSAERYFRMALAINEKLGAEKLGTAFDLRCLSLALVKTRQLDAAHVSAHRSLEIRRKLLSPSSSEIGTSLTALGEIALARGEFDASLKHYEDALAIYAGGVFGSAFQAEAHYGIGRVHRRQGRLSLAEKALSQAIAALEQQGTRLGGAEEAKAGFGAGYSGYYREYLEVLLKLDRPAEAYHVLERSSARSLLAMLAERDVLLSSDLAPELVRERQANHDAYDQVQADLARFKPGGDDQEISRLQGCLRELREDAAYIAARMRQASPRAASIQYPEPLDLHGARSALDPGTTLIAYSIGEEETFLFVVQAEEMPGEGLSVFTLPVGHKALREKVQRLRHLIEARRSSPLIEAAELYDLLLRPAERVFSTSDRLLISPDGPLHVLPFAALARTHGQRRASYQYLVEWKPLHIVGSATVYAEIKKDRRPSTTRFTLAAFGDPRYPPPKADDKAPRDTELRRVFERGVALSPLPSTRLEVRSIAALYGRQAVSFLGENATEGRLKLVAKDARYLHIASHAVLDESLPLNSGLALTIPETPTPGQDNGLLQAWEIFDGLRIDADLVTLSACKTALGKDMGGEGLMGLTRAFQYAGARSVLASLWSVADRSTARFMRTFYGQLVGDKSKDEALRGAQLQLLRSKGPESHPWYWAAFELFGAWQ